jgi:hypothetical protein
MSKIKFGIASLQAAQENYNILLDKLIKGYQKIMKKDPEGLDLIKIKQEARQRADESAKVVDMQGRNLDPSKGIMGGTQDFGENIRETYDAAKGPGKGDEMVEALKSPGAIKSSEIIEAQLKETFPDIKLFGDETFEEILEIQKTGKHPRMKADGGRVNLQVGGLPLSEQGQRIYDSMTRAGFDEMAIARALDEQQAYPEATTLGLQSQIVVPPRVQPILPINQGDSGGNIINRDRGLMTADVVGTSLVGNMGLTEEEQEEVNQQKRKSGLMNLGKTLGFITNPLAFLAKKGYDMYQSNVQKGIDARDERIKQEAIAAQKREELQLAAQNARTEAQRIAAIESGYGGYDNSPGATGPTAGGAGMGVGGGYASDYGFAKGGLATMFVRKR